METDPIINKKNQQGKNFLKSENAKRAAFATAAAVAGAGTVVGAEAVLGHGLLDEEVVKPEDPISPPNGPAQSDQQQNQPEQPAHQDTPTQAQQQATTHNEPTPQDTPVNPAEPVNPEPPQAEPNASLIDEVNPDDVAVEVVEAEYIDPTDLDAPDLAVVSVGTVTTLDNQVMSAVQIAGENGEDLYLVDLDGDQSLDVLVSDTGEVLAEVPGTLTVDDAESLLTQHDVDSGYLAQGTEPVGADELAAGIEQDITNLDA